MWHLPAAAAAVLSAGAHAGTRRAASWPQEPPFYPLYPGRHVRVLNGTWSFAFLGDVPFEAAVPRPAAWQEVAVPDAFDLRPDAPRCGDCWPDPGNAGAGGSLCERCCDRAYGQRGDATCWESPEQGGAARSFEHCCGQDPLRLRRGVAAYRAEVESPPDTRDSGAAALLLFAGCALHCLVAVDGAFLADHVGLSPFSVEVPAGDPGQRSRSVLVLVDNRFDSRTNAVHQPKYDWYQAGGLLRTVQWHFLPTAAAVFISGVDVFPRSLREVDVHVGTSESAAARPGLSYRWRFDDAGSGCQVSAEWGELEPARGLRGVAVPDARAWSPGSPSLHRLKVAVVGAGHSGRLLDCIEVRFGLRVVGTRGRHILLNGEPVKLLGFNRHDMTDTPVLSYEEVQRDIAILRLSGANFVRGSHYPQDQRFLDLCDVHGLLVWEEVLSWQPRLSDFSDGIFMLQSLRMADELVAASVNHPSVVIFAFFNEGDSGDESPATGAAYGSMASRLRARSGGTRLVTWGSNAAMNDKHLAHADICAFHDYTAWYPTTQPASFEEVHQILLVWEAYGHWVEEAYPDKPLLISEAGAGGLFRRRGPSEEKWTEEYQSLVMQMHLLAALQNTRIAGIALWQFADVPIDQNTSTEAERPRGLNNKGLLGLGRQPKIAFQAVRLLLEQQKRPNPYVGLILPEEDAEKRAGSISGQFERLWSRT